MEIIVIQKNAPGQLEVSVIANTTVNTNIRTCTKIPQTMRVVRFPLKINFIFLINHIVFVFLLDNLNQSNLRYG